MRACSFCDPHSAKIKPLDQKYRDRFSAKFVFRTTGRPKSVLVEEILVIMIQERETSGFVLISAQGLTANQPYRFVTVDKSIIKSKLPWYVLFNLGSIKYD